MSYMHDCYKHKGKGNIKLNACGFLVNTILVLWLMTVFGRSFSCLS